MSPWKRECVDCGQEMDSMTEHVCPVAPLLAEIEALRRERDEAVRLLKHTQGELDGAVGRYQTAERLLEESDQEYENLVHVLQLRFPRRPDGSLPDWKVEDVLEENRVLWDAKVEGEMYKARYERAQNNLAAMQRDINHEHAYRVAEAEGFGQQILALKAKLQRAREALQWISGHRQGSDAAAACADEAMADLDEGGDGAKPK